MSFRVACPRCSAVNTCPESERTQLRECNACGQHFPVEPRGPRKPPRARVVPPPQVAADDDMPVADFAELPEPLPIVVPRPAQPQPMPQPPGLPFKLQPDERILLRGGFGGTISWMWLFTFLPMCLFCFSPLVILQSVAAGLKHHYPFVVVWGLFLPPLLVAGFWPLLRSGRYWLTTERLIWKPRIGRLRELALADVRTDEIVAKKLWASLRVRGRRESLSLRYIGGLERLWGGILLLAEMDADGLPATGKGVADVAWWRAHRGKGLSGQPGLVVLRPGYVAFLPTGASKNLGREFFKESVGKAISDALGRKEKFPAEAELPFDVLVGLMSERDPAEFDQFVWDAVEQHEGLVWEAHEADVFREAIPFVRRREMIGFRSAGVTLRGLPARDQVDTVARLLALWSGGARIPKRFPVLRTTLIGLFFAVAAGLLTYMGKRSDEPTVDVGTVSAADVMDLTAAPDKAFVTVSGHPDLERTVRIPPKKKETGAGAVLLVFKESPRLVLYLPDDHELNKALLEREKQAGKTGKNAKKVSAATKEALTKEWTVSGRLYPDGADGSPHTTIPTRDVRNFVNKELGEPDAATTRVLKVGMTPRDVVAITWISYGFAILFGTVAALLGYVTLRMLVLARREPAS